MTNDVLTFVQRVMTKTKTKGGFIANRCNSSSTYAISSSLGTKGPPLRDVDDGVDDDATNVTWKEDENSKVKILAQMHGGKD
jgi:hypothetical protein